MDSHEKIVRNCVVSNPAKYNILISDFLLLRIKRIVERLKIFPWLSGITPQNLWYSGEFQLMLTAQKKNRTFLEVDSMVVSWWIVAFCLASHVNILLPISWIFKQQWDQWFSLWASMCSTESRHWNEVHSQNPLQTRNAATKSEQCNSKSTD